MQESWGRGAFDNGLEAELAFSTMKDVQEASGWRKEVSMGVTAESFQGEAEGGHL